MSNRSIPLVDLSSFVNGDEAQKQAFVEALGKAFHEVGFVGVINHQVPKDLIDGFYASSKAFFSLPVDVKRKYEIAGLAGQRGYTSYGKEHAKQSAVADLKEFYQIGQYVSDDHSLKHEYPTNPTVTEIEGFSDYSQKLYKAFEGAGAHLLRAIALYLGLDEACFAEDINLITLLVGASAGGLQLLNSQGEWLDIVPEADEIVINVGDMLQRLTNNYLVSTTHRVVNPPREQWHVPRLSIPFFLHPKSSMDLTCLPATVTEERPLAYEPITAGDYLNERLREIGLKK